MLWILIASTKTNAQLFSTPPLQPSFTGGFWANLVGIFSYNEGIFGRWLLNSVVYAIGGGVISTLIAGVGGYALGKYRFRGSKLIFRCIVLTVLLPQVTLAIPQFLLLAHFGMTNSYASVILPQLVSPFAVYICKIYAEAAVPDEILEASRIDGASESRALWSVGLRLMFPALVTVFLLQFVGIWNNFLLPFVMLTGDQLYPVTLGLYGLMVLTGATTTQYSLVIAGVLVSIVPLVVLFLFLQKYWRVDLISGGVKM